MLYGAIEAGGTKFVCAVSDEQFNIKARISIPTTHPAETMTAVLDFFKDFSDIAAIGVGSFGPIDINHRSPTYGFITTTPKLAWANYDFIGALKAHYSIPIAWTTDVNAAAYGELKKGAAKGKSSCIYITVGTGIGGGAVVKNHILEGFGHPEMGHVLVRRHPQDTYQGNCPYHHDCLEGMAAGPAIEDRCGKKAQELDADDQAWEMEAYYLAQAILDYTLILSPEKIILGGGVMKQTHLFSLIRQSFAEQLADYVQTPPLDEYIVPCELADDAGITGCLLLAADQL